MQKREIPSAMLFKPMDLIDIQDVESDNKSVTFKTWKKAGKVTEVLNVH